MFRHARNGKQWCVCVYIYILSYKIRILSVTLSLGKWLDVGGVLFLGNLTSSIDLNPWVKDADAQRAGELIDPVLKVEGETQNNTFVVK